MEKTYAVSEKIFVKLIETAEEVIRHYPIREIQYFAAISSLGLLPEDFIRERSDVEKRMERVYREALNFFISSTPTSRPTEYVRSIARVAKEAKRQLNLTFGCIDSIDNLEEIIEEAISIIKDRKCDKYEHDHFGMWVDWEEYKKREEEVDEKMKKILEDMKNKNIKCTILKI